MRRIALLLILTAVVAPIATFAQHVTTQNGDSSVSTTDPEVTQEMQEVVIQAPKVIHKSDMDVFYPSSSAVAYSKNGMQLVHNLRIPSLSVNEVLGTITTSGEHVQVRINGREATMEQVKSLLPETVKRVEWMDDPGLRYQGAVAVLNFVVINPKSGGSLMADGMQALNCAWGPYHASLKFNSGRSQVGVNAGYKITNRLATYRDYNETFTFANGETFTRTETPIGGYGNDNYGMLQLDYSYIKPDTTIVWIALHGYKQWNDDELHQGIMTQSNGQNDILLRDYSGEHGFTPSLSAYFEQHFANNQVIAVDFKSSFYKGNTYRTYTEHDNITSALINDVNTAISDRNQAYGLEANYIKRWQASRFTAGVSYNANRNRSTYEHLDNEIFHQRQDNVYFFGEYFQRIHKVTLTMGIGAQYTDFNFRETHQGNHSWNLRPQFAITYRPNSTSSINLNLTSWQDTPSLAQTNIAAQQTDGIQWRIGNPDLHTSSAYQLTLRYKYTSNRIVGTFSIRAFDSPDAITPYLYWQDDKLVTSYENSKGLKWVSFTLAPQIDVVPGWLSLSGSLHYRMEQSKGLGYTHDNRHLSGDVSLTAYHWGCSLLVQYEKAPKKLSGETYSWGETVSLLMLGYNWKSWEFGFGVFCPFTQYDSGSQSLNRYNSNTSHLRLDMSAMPFVRLAYNLQWGQQKHGVHKMVDAEAKVETSSAGGR